MIRIRIRISSIRIYDGNVDFDDDDMIRMDDDDEDFDDNIIRID